MYEYQIKQFDIWVNHHDYVRRDVVWKMKKNEKTENWKMKKKTNRRVLTDNQKPDNQR